MAGIIGLLKSQVGVRSDRINSIAAASGDRGFTLVEAMAALAIVLVAVGAFSSGFVGMTTSNRSSQRRNDAMLLARQQIDLLRQQDIAALPTNGMQTMPVATSNGDNFTVTTDFCPTNAPQNFCTTPNQRHIRVTVVNNDSPNPERSQFVTETVFVPLN